MIRVLLTGPTLNESVGGIAVHIKNLITLFQNSDTVKLEHFPITAGRYNRESWFSKIQRLIQIVTPFLKKMNSCNVIHLNSTFDDRSIIRDFFYIFLAVGYKRNKIILQFHGGKPSDVHVFRSKLSRFFCEWLLGNVSCILILSEYQKKQFNQFFKYAKVQLVPNCLPAGQSHKKIASQNHIVFLFIGRISESKGILEIIGASRLLLNEGLPFKINICGTGPLEERVKDEIFQYRLTQYIHYHGFVQNDSKEKVFLESDVMLLPTNHNEGFPYALLEAFSHAMPVIGTSKGAIPEVIENGSNGFIIDSKDTYGLFKKMKFFCENPQKIKMMGDNAKYKLITEYNCEKLQNKLTEIYI